MTHSQSDEDIMKRKHLRAVDSLDSSDLSSHMPCIESQENSRLKPLSNTVVRGSMARTGNARLSRAAALRRVHQAESRVVEALGVAGEMTLGWWDEAQLASLLRTLAGALADLRQLEREVGDL